LVGETKSLKYEGILNKSMRFEEKYVDSSEKDAEKIKDKKIITDDTFAIGEVIQNLVDKIQQLSVQMRLKK